MLHKFRPALVALTVVPVAVLASTVQVGSTGSIQSAVDACPAAGCEIVLTDADYALPREVWIEGRSNLVLRRSDAMAQQGVRPRLHLAANATPFDVAGTASNPTDPQRPAGWKRWPISSKDTVGGALDSTDSWSTRGFQFNGQIVVYKSTDVVLEGLEVDGGGIAVFQNQMVWSGKYAIVHGNVGVNLVLSARTVVRDCDIHGFFAGLYINNRNTSGIFADTAATEGLFGSIDSLGARGAGDHVVERNRVHDSHWAVYDESEWDLGSTFRFNRAWNLAPAALAVPNPREDETINQTGGWMYLKDVVGPVHRVHNNTISANPILVGYSAWRGDMQQMFYNNIVTWGPGSSSSLRVNDWHQLAGSSSRWFWNNTFEIGAADSLYRFATADSVLALDSSVIVPDAPVRYRTQFLSVSDWTPARGAQVPFTLNGQWHQAFMADGIETFPGGGQFAKMRLDSVLASDSRSRSQLWLVQAPFASRDPASSQFLAPLWDSATATRSITGMGWSRSGWASSASGSNPDVGAIQRNGIPTRILQLRSQLPFAISGNQVSVPLQLRDPAFWKDVRIEAVEAWTEGSRTSFFSPMPPATMLPRRIALALSMDSAGILPGQNLFFQTLSALSKDSILRIHVTISAWSDSLGGRRTSEVACFKGFVGSATSAGALPRSGALHGLAVRRVGDHLWLTLPVRPSARVEILSADGRTLWSGELPTPSGQAEIPLQSLPRGTWIVRAQVDGARYQAVVPGF